MKKSLLIYNQYLKESDYTNRNKLYKDFHIECNKEKLTEAINKLSFNKKSLELLVFPFAVIYLFLFN